MIIAYTIKGYGLPTAGHPQNHSSLLTVERIRRSSPPIWAWTRRTRGAGSTPTARRAGCARPPRTGCAATRFRHCPRRRFPTDIGRTPKGTATTQAALGRVLLDLTREAPDAAKRVVTVSPDVSSTTNLGGLGQQGRRVVGGRAAQLVRRRRRDDHALAREAHRAAHGTRHRRDQPGRTDGRARRHLEPVGAAAVPDRGDVRPVRRTRPRTVVVRHLRRRTVDPGRHPVRGHPRRRRRCAPVDQDPVDRPRTARLHQLRTGVRDRRRVDAARQHRPGSAARTAPRRTCGCPPARSTRPWPRCPTDPAARERRRRQVVAGGYPLAAPRRCAVTIVGDGRDDHRSPRRRRSARRAGHARRRRVHHQPRAAVRGRAGPAGPRTGRQLDPRSAVPRRPGHPDGHRPRRPPAHPGLPRRHQPGAQRRLGCQQVRAGRLPRRRLPLPRHRHRQHRRAPPSTSSPDRQPPHQPGAGDHHGHRTTRRHHACGCRPSGRASSEGTVTRWLKQPGDHIDAEEPLLEVATDKVDTEIPSPVAGILDRILAEENDVVAVGAGLAIIVDLSTGPVAGIVRSLSPCIGTCCGSDIPCRGSVTGNRLPPRLAVPREEPTPGGTIVEKLPRIRRTIARRMVESLQVAAQLTTVLESMSPRSPDFVPHTRTPSTNGPGSSSRSCRSSPRPQWRRWRSTVSSMPP